MKENIKKYDWKDIVFWIVVIVFIVAMGYLFLTGRAIK